MRPICINFKQRSAPYRFVGWAIYCPPIFNSTTSIKFSNKLAGDELFTFRFLLVGNVGCVEWWATELPTLRFQIHA